MEVEKTSKMGASCGVQVKIMKADKILKVGASCGAKCHKHPCPRSHADMPIGSSSSRLASASSMAMGSSPSRLASDSSMAIGYSSSKLASYGSMAIGSSSSKLAMPSQGSSSAIDTSSRFLQRVWGQIDVE